MDGKTGTCEACNKPGNLFPAVLSCERCGKHNKNVFACGPCLENEKMTKFGGMKCKACSGNLCLKRRNMASIIPTSYSQFKTAEKLTFKEKQNLRSPHKVAIPKTHSNVTDNKNHFPIPNLSHASNALAQLEKYDSAPDWWSGSLASLKSSVKSAVNREFPGLKKKKENRE